MKLLKLENSQHGQTRKLWEEVFQEDSKAFLDYYYFLKTRVNQIYVIDEDDDIRSMLQLNPYVLQIENKQHLCHYIIAVATEMEYRKRGYMGELLRKSMQEMYDNKEPFTFLMPAEEAIYTPYDFRFIYAQNQRGESGKEGEPEVTIVDAMLGDGDAMAAFFTSEIAPLYQVYAVRDGQYYQTMIFEQQSENGGVKLLKKDGVIVGMYPYARADDKIEIREPVYVKAYETDFLKSVYGLSEAGGVPVIIYAGQEHAVNKKVPLIMARILNLEVLLKALKVKAGTQIHCSFAVLDTILTKNCKVWRIRSTEDNDEMQVAETEDSEGVLSIGALTSLLFGYKTLEEISHEEDVFLSDHLKQELYKIQPLKNVFLNEIV